MPLNPKQQAFVQHYVATHNATRAAIAAGYSERSAYSQAHDLLKKPEIAEAIADREANLADELGLTKQRLLLAQWAVYEKALAGAPKVTKDGETITAVDPETGDRRIVYEWSPSGANKALETLMRHRGMLTDRQEVSHTGPVVYTLDLGRELDSDGDSAVTPDDRGADGGQDSE